MKVYRYYCLYRPPMPGTIPRGMVHIEDFGERRKVQQINREVWGYVEYEHRLSKQEVDDYELVEGLSTD